LAENQERQARTEAEAAQNESEAIRQQTNNFAVDPKKFFGGRVAFGVGTDVLIDEPGAVGLKSKRLTGGHDAPVYCVTFDGSGERIASGAADGRPRKGLSR